ncbi:hypothetical protein B0H13DRAFT_1584622, partial [Mycena leptocephala]
LDITKSIISGSTSLLPLANFDFIPHDLDIYSPIATGAAMLEALQNVFEFTIDRAATDSYPLYIGISRIYWLTKGRHFINLIIVEGDNAATAVFHFHSTIVMNFIVGKGLVCTYPLLTLRKLSLVNTSLLMAERSIRQTLRCIVKYMERG